MPSEKPWVQQGWWAFQDLLGPLDIQANRDPMGTLAPEAFLALWELWVRLATLDPRESVERREIKEKWDVAIPGCLGHQGSQVFLAGLARPSTARMETEGPQGPQERLGGLGGRAQWGSQAFVSLLPAWEPQPIPLLASRSLGLSRGHERPARTEPASTQGHLWVDMHPGPRRLGFSRSCLEGTQGS